MIPRGAQIGYKASVTIDPAMLSCQTTFPNTIKAFVSAVTSKLETTGLLPLNYQVRKATGPNQFFCVFVLQTINGFPSRQAIVDRVNALIAQETGAAPRFGVDPLICPNIFQNTFVPCPQPLISAGGGYTPAQIAAGLPGQCPNGPGGTGGTFFPNGPLAGTTGPTLNINAAGVQSSITDQILGGVASVGTSINNAIKKVVPDTSTFFLIVAAVLGIGLLFTYTYGKAGGRIV